MSDDLLKISLNQGTQFTNYQTKINNMIHNSVDNSLIQEGFVTAQQEMIVQPKEDGYVSVLQNQQYGSSLTNTVNQKDLDELKDLQSKYNVLIQQYTTIQKSIGDASLLVINRLSKNNPYLNKTIRFTTGHIC